MEPRKEPHKPEAPEHREPVKKRRFQIVKLEERIAPDKGGKGTHNCGGHSSNSGSTFVTGGSCSVY